MGYYRLWVITVWVISGLTVCKLDYAVLKGLGWFDLFVFICLPGVVCYRFIID